MKKDSVFLRQLKAYALLTLGLLFSLPVSADAPDQLSLLSKPLIHWKNGQQTTLRELLELGGILIFTEKDCGACRKYIKSLEECRPEVRSRIKYVSVNTPAQTRSLVQVLPRNADIYVFKNLDNVAKEIPATPATFVGSTASAPQIGLLSCERLQELRTQEANGKKVANR